MIERIERTDSIPPVLRRQLPPLPERRDVSAITAGTDAEWLTEVSVDFLGESVREFVVSAGYSHDAFEARVNLDEPLQVGIIPSIAEPPREGRILARRYVWRDERCETRAGWIGHLDVWSDRDGWLRALQRHIVVAHKQDWRA